MVFAFLGGPQNGFTQNRKKLESQRKKLNEQIEYKSKLLQKTTKQGKAALNDLNLLKRKISDRQELIANIKTEIRILEQQVANEQLVLKQLNENLEQLKFEYAEILRSIQANKSALDRIMFVFASEDFNQAFKRLKYLEQYTEYRKIQVAQIKKTQEEIQQKIQSLEALKAEKNNLIILESQELLALGNEINNKESLVKDLSTRESQLKNQLKRDQQEADKLQNAIAEIIRKEREKKAELTAEGKITSKNFEGNKGKLPWPVSNGVITKRFGKQAHPVLKGIYINNNGIDITTENTEQCRAVFDGVVSGVISITGSGKTVMVRHGAYLTIYSNLAETYVKNGDKIKAKQNIGKIINDNGSTVLHFEVWNETKIMNPMDWIYKR